MKTNNNNFSNTQNIVLANILANGIDKERVMELLAPIYRDNNIDHTMRVALYIAGMIEKPVLAKRVANNGTIYTMTDFDFVSNIVWYTYPHKQYRCFKSEEDAKEFNKSGKYDYNTSSSTSKPSNDYPHLGSFACEQNSSISIDQWENYKVVE